MMIIFDILRIIAALMVFTIHLFIFVPELPRSLCDVLSNGGYGVSIFFVMSGFLIFQSLKNSKSLKEYYLKRVSRIVPSYYAILIFAIVVWDKMLNMMPNDELMGLGWLRYFLFLNTWIPSAEYDSWNNLWGLWTIGCFVFFYAVAPLIKKFITNFKTSMIFMIIAIIVTFAFSKVMPVLFTSMGASMPDMLACDNPIYSLNTFSMGICAWYAYTEGKTKDFLKVVSLILVGFVGLNMYNRMLWGILAAIVMICFIDLDFKNESLKKVIKVLGRYSFSLYLVHLPVLKIMEYMQIVGVKFILLAPVICVVAAVVVYHIVEQPCAKLIKKLA